MAAKKKKRKKRKDVEPVPLLAIFEETVHSLSYIKQRLRLLKAIRHESELLAVAFPGSQVENHLFGRFYFDTKDMLVLDLGSLREGLTNGGFFQRLKAHVASLTEPKGEGSLNKERCAVFRKLFPSGTVTEEGIQRLADDFNKRTKRLDRARNLGFLAHRYEPNISNDPRKILNLAQIEEQVGVFEDYIGDLGGVFLDRSYIFVLQSSSNIERAARDFMDVSLHGSIDVSCGEYGVTPHGMREGDPAPPWYDDRRKEFLKNHGVKDP